MLTIDHFLNLDKELQYLLGQRDLLLQKKIDTIAKVSTAKARLLLEDDVKLALEELQYTFYSRNLKSIESMLTAMMRETLPYLSDSSIKLDLYSKGGISQLDICLEKGSNLQSTSTKKSKKQEELIEDVYEDNGGALTNIISVGTQFIALANTTQRRFISLDEPDCWIQPERILDFSSIITQVAKKSGFQVLYISHHDLNNLSQHANIARLETDENDKRYFSQVVINDQWENKTDVGIRAIELINFKAYEYATLNLYPGVNYLIGENNKGKSVINSAIRAVAYNESKDSCIRHWYDKEGNKHFADKAQVIIHLENDYKLIWTRSRKGSPKVQYELTHPSFKERKIEDGERNQIIDWVKNLLGIYPSDELDIQLVNQKNPVFLLNEKGSTRAKILSVGQEHIIIQSGQEKYKQILREDKKTVKEGEDFIFKLNSKLEEFDLLLLQINKELSKQFSQFINGTKNKEILNKHIKLIEANIGLKAVSEISIKPIVLTSSEKISHFLSVYSILQKLNIGVKLPVEPKLVDQSKFIDAMTFLNKIKKLATSVITSKVELTTLTDSAPILEAGKKIKELDENKQKLNKEIQMKKELLKKASDSKDHFISHILDNHCPLCMADNFKDRI